MLKYISKDVEHHLEAMFKHVDNNKAEMAVSTKFTKDGKYIRTAVSLCVEMLLKIQEYSGPGFCWSKVKVLVVDTFEFIPVLLTFGVKPCNITYVAPYTIMCRFATARGVNVVQTNLLQWDNKNNMEFDLVIGNPPYQDNDNSNFYQSFVYKAWEMTADYVAMVMPGGWVSTGNARRTFVKDVIKNKVIAYGFLGKEFFKEQVVATYIITSKLTKSDNVNLTVDYATTSTNRATLEFFPTSKLSSALRSILNKIKDKADKGHMVGIAGSLSRKDAIASTAHDAVKCIYTAGYKGCDFDWGTIEPTTGLVGFGSHKVVLTHQTSLQKLGELKYAGVEYGIGRSAHAFIVGNRTEASNLICYMNSKVIKCLVAQYKGTVASNSQSLFNKIPTIDLTKAWSDEELYAHFELTQEEIDYIENTVK